MNMKPEKHENTNRNKHRKRTKTRKTHKWKVLKHKGLNELFAFKPYAIKLLLNHVVLEI